MGGQRHVSAALTPGKTRYPLSRRLSGPQGRSGRVRKISSPTGFDPRTVQPVASRYTDQAIAIHCLSRYYHYLSTVPINPFRPNPSHSATDSLSDFVEIFLAGLHLLGGAGEVFFPPTEARTPSRQPCSCGPQSGVCKLRSSGLASSE